MPPKRKAAAAKAAAPVETVENGADSAEPPKAKRGRATKQADKQVENVVVEKKPRITRNKAAAPAVEEKQVTEEEKKTQKKGKATKVADDKIKEPVVAKRGAAKKREAKPKKEAVVVAKKRLSAVTPKTNRASKNTRRVKKGDEEAAEKSTTTKTKKAVKKKIDKPEPETESKSKKPRQDPENEGKGETVQNQTDTDYTNVDFSCNKQNARGNLPNLKISSWNVDGVRAWLKKNGQEYAEHEKPDILCLQETKCSQEKIPDELNKFLDYYSYWCCSVKEGYAGVALFSKLDPLSVKYGIDNEEFDEEGRCITAEYEEFYLVNVYVPNAGRKLVTLPKRLEWNAIFNEFIDKLDEKKPVIVCGDMNVAHNEIDLANPKTNKRNAGFTEEERTGFTEFLGEQYVDTFRSLYPDQKNAYTFWTYMMKARAKDVGWRLDYFIVSKRLLDNVCDNVIRSRVYGSDHCPITLFLNI